jgi:hypothetical protein
LYRAYSLPAARCPRTPAPRPRDPAGQRLATATAAGLSTSSPIR